MVVLVVGKSTFCNMLFSSNEIKVILEKLESKRLQEIVKDDEIFVDRGLSKWESEYTKLITGEKVFTEVSVDEEMIRLANRLNTTKLLLIIEKVTEIPEKQLMFREPAYYLVTLT